MCPYVKICVFCQRFKWNQNEIEMNLKKTTLSQLYPTFVKDFFLQIILYLFYPALMYLDKTFDYIRIIRHGVITWLPISIRTLFFKILHSKFFGQCKIVHFYQAVVHYVTGKSWFSRQTKESREISHGQTPFTMITKIIKTASLKTDDFDPKINSKFFQNTNFLIELLCKFLVQMLQYLKKYFRFFFRPWKLEKTEI